MQLVILDFSILGISLFGPLSTISDHPGQTSMTRCLVRCSRIAGTLDILLNLKFTREFSLTLPRQKKSATTVYKGPVLAISVS